MAKILLVEDDKALAGTVQLLLEMEKHTVEWAKDGQEAGDRLAAFDYDLLILDWDVPFKTGVEVCRDYRNKGGSAPVLMLTAKEQISDKEQGLDSGADDYLTKPYNPRELAARVRALLRRMPQFAGDKLKWRDIEVNLESRKVMRGGEEITLQPMEFKLVVFLMKNPGQVFSNEALLKRCWDDDAEVSSDSIYTCIRRIRKKLDQGEKASIIRTVHGIGYGLGDENAKG